MNWSADVVVLVPLEVVTVTSTVPADSAGDVAVHDVVEEQLIPVAALEPKATVGTPVAVRKCVPVIVTPVPPAVEPLVGLIAVTVGKGT